MTFTDDEIRACFEDEVDETKKRIRWWENGEVPTDGTTTYLYAVARQFEYLGKLAALLGAVHQSRTCFGEVAKCYLAHIEACRLRRDMTEQAKWNHEPQMFARAVNAAVLSRDEELLANVAAATLAMDESYLDAFTESSLSAPARYYNAKVKAAIAIDDKSVRALLTNLEESLERFEEKSPYWEAIPVYYRALVDGSESAAQTSLSELYDYYAAEEPDPDDPRWFVLHHVCAHIVLARRRGLRVSRKSGRLPEALLREDMPADDTELDVDVDLDAFQVTSDVGFFELERDEDDRPVIAGRIYHPGGEPVSADDVPEREAGRVLSDEWVAAALEEATWRDAYDDELVADATAAFEDGTVGRKLVVVQDRTDEHTFDESLAELPVDDVTLLKGAGRRR
ncbi:hypothetical protein [Natronosalvus caseinilyticus]|uniref:hypothetical protein n=1 Tax=Natronosalvus caseinilyticus TaxID=2953747 RepID=UPI0028AA1EE9|nr:hypothetical protein [Natronosalvus caseinilyticus]